MRSAVNVLWVVALVSSLALSSPAQAENLPWGQEVSQFIQKHAVKRNGLTYLSLKTFGVGHQLGMLSKIMEKSIGVGFNATYVGNGMPGHTEVFLGKMKSDFIGSRNANFYNMMDDTLHGLVVAVYVSKTTGAIEAAQSQFKNLSGAINSCNLRPFKMAGGSSTLVPEGNDQWEIINTQRNPRSRRVDGTLIKQGRRCYLETHPVNGVKVRAEVTPQRVEHNGKKVKGLVLEGLSCASYVTRTLNEVLKDHPDSGLPPSIINTIAARQVSANIVSGNLNAERKPDLILHLSANDAPMDVYEAALRVAGGNPD